MQSFEQLRSARELIVLAGLFIAGLVVASPAAAQQSITYQAQLKQSGAPFTGMADLEFRLYDSLVGGTQVGGAIARIDWPVEEGLFQVELDFGAGSFGADPRWLQITVDGSTLTPRQRVHAAPMAMFALAGNEGPPGADGAEGPPGDSHWIINGTATAYLDGNVGVGVPDPAGALDVHGNSSIGFPQMQLFETEDDFARLTFANAVSDRFWTLAALTRGDNLLLDRFNLFHSVSGDLVRVDGEGNVGLGGNPPNSVYRLSVGGGMLLTRDSAPGTLAHLAITESAGSEAVRQLFWNSAASRGWRIDSVVDADPANERWSLSTTGTGINAEVLSVLGSGAVGIGYPAPPSALTVRSRGAWTWDSGNGRGDFYVGDGLVGLSMGVALGGGGRGVSRIWTNGGVEHLFFGSAGYGVSMSILPGQVGINTTAPTATLDVDGGARVRGLSHTDGTPRSIRVDNDGNLVADQIVDWIMVPMEAFTPTQDSDQYSKFNGLSGVSGSSVFVAPVDLPHGAEITEITKWFRDDSAASELVVVLCRRATTNAFNSCNLMADLQSSGASPDIRS
ncbi:MAG TPA: hypothetical protein VJ908_06075, partial [Wenzhouxiangellaceae bacterium]|nr:hypothetical protein [Wenzhouxiangellaceae bacterium]